ncbi:metalloregulator ArsR/SmtB family transcription factor [Persicobacter psychrovividus]|uniref:Transcriptional regulator n=1 Tax=Persicobacter psychrovividus TaxID=387638 RepID=A0ABM7VH29_9BACT|nr:transcriptional regulator [Persicobacter psychrovividus]
MNSKDKISFSEEQIRMATLAKAIAHPARIAILQHLLDANECICGDFVSKLPLSQSTVSQHLKELKNAGLINASANPPKMMYCINKPTFDELEQYFKNLVNRKAIKDCCEK